MTTPLSTDDLNARYDPMTRDELIAECERLTRQMAALRADGRLNLIGSRSPVPHCLVDQRQSLVDELAVPGVTVLILEQHERAGGVREAEHALALLK